MNERWGTSANCVDLVPTSFSFCSAAVQSFQPLLDSLGRELEDDLPLLGGFKTHIGNESLTLRGVIVRLA